MDGSLTPALPALTELGLELFLASRTYPRASGGYAGFFKGFEELRGPLLVLIMNNPEMLTRRYRSDLPHARRTLIFHQVLDCFVFEPRYEHTHQASVVG